MMDDITKAIAEHMHDGNFAQRINLYDIFGYLPTVTVQPSAAPSNIYGQYVIYNGAIWAYDFLNGVWISSQPSGSYQPAGAYNIALFDHYVDANNVTTNETDLYTDTLTAGKLAANGDKIFARYQGIFTGAAASTQDLRAYFGGTSIYDSGALSIGAATDHWTMEVMLIRVSASVVRASVNVSTDFATLFPYSNYTQVTGLTLSATQILKITGQAGGAGALSNQITANLGAVSYQPAA